MSWLLSLMPWWAWCLAIVGLLLVGRLMLRRDRPAVTKGFYGHVAALLAVLVVSPEWKVQTVTRPARKRRPESTHDVQVLESNGFRAVYEGGSALELLAITWKGSDVLLSFYAGELTSVMIDDEQYDDVSSIVRNGRGRAMRTLSAVRESLGLDGYGATDYEATLKDKKAHANAHRIEIDERLHRGKKRKEE